MERISSKSTYFYKRLFPVIWLGFLVVFVTVALVGGRGSHATNVPFLFFPAAMGVLGYVFFRQFLFVLVDEVWDDGDALIIRNAGAGERVALRNIINIGYSSLTNPERVTLRLRNSGSPGRDVTFIPLLRFRLFRFSHSPIIDDLIERVDRARRQIP